MNFFKEVFSAKNMKLSMLMWGLTNPNLTKGDYLSINKSIRNIRDEEEVQQRKAA